MAFEPKTWTCGETITADELNRMEQGIADGGGGYECTEEVQTLYNETVEINNNEGVPFPTDGKTIDNFPSDNPISLTVTLDNISYEFERQYRAGSGGMSDIYWWGGNDSNYPYPAFGDDQITIQRYGDNAPYIYIKENGTHAVVISATTLSAETTECFRAAVTPIASRISEQVSRQVANEVVDEKGLKNIKDSYNGGIIEGAVSDNFASGQYAHAEGSSTTASGNYSHAEGDRTTASGDRSHAEGINTTASGNNSHAEGIQTTAEGNYSHAEGYKSSALGQYSHAEGYQTKADSSSHAEGSGTTASGHNSHAEGNNTTASGETSHAEGYQTKASGADSHAEGNNTTASYRYSHAEGYYTTASGENSHAEGNATIANHKSQHVFGEYNVADPSTATSDNRGNYIEIIGNGTNNNNRSNARTLDWSGNESLQGSLTLGKGTADETTITATQLKALLALLNA